jgi:uncharacterized protein (TIGR02246 family)
MKTIFLLFVISFSTFAQSSDKIITDEDKIRQVMNEQENAWNKGDAKEYVKSFMEEGIFTIISGATYHTQTELEERVAFIFSTIFKNSSYNRKINQIKFIAENIALVELEVEIANYQGLPPGVKASEDKILRTSMLQVLMKGNDEWSVAAFHNVDVKVPK